jgi:hypothetical protein
VLDLILVCGHVLLEVEAVVGLAAAVLVVTIWLALRAPK